MSVYVNRCSRSCGFYISATKHLGPETCVGPYCSSGVTRCSNNYTDIAFSCTNTTYVDGNGDADGVTVFVAKNCTTDKRLGSDHQDVKYSGNSNDVPILGFSESTEATFVVAEGNIMTHPTRHGDSPAAPDPGDDDTCNRGCICGYSPQNDQIISYPWLVFPAYLFCKCDTWLSVCLVGMMTGQPLSVYKVFATAANISLLDHYSVNYTGLVTTNSSTNAVPFQRPFECFGNPLTVGAAVFQYEGN